MALPIYPTTLKCPLLSNAASKEGESFIRSSFEYDPRQRQTTIGKPTAGFSMNVDQTQFDIFKAFWNDEIYRGTREFSVDWTTHGAIGQKIVRFMVPYTVKPAKSGLYNVSCQIEILEGA